MQPTRPQPLTVKESENVKPAPLLDPQQRYHEEAARVDEVIQQYDKLEDKIYAAIRQVHDPEIPVNIYDLGLIYDVDIDEEKNVRVTMTLTSAACPVAQELPAQVRRNIGRVPEVKQVEVEVVFDPPWSQERMSDEAKLMLGLL